VEKSLTEARRSLASTAVSWSRIHELGEKISARFVNSELVEDFMDQLPVPMLSIDADGTILLVNQAWLDEFGYNRSVIGRNIAGFVTQTSYRSAVALSRAGASLRGETLEFYCNGGKLKRARLYCSAKMSNSGILQHSRCVLVPETTL